MIELKSLVVIDCLRPESVSKLAWCNASLYGANGKIIRMARFAINILFPIMSLCTIPGLTKVHFCSKDVISFYVTVHNAS